MGRRSLFEGFFSAFSTAIRALTATHPLIWLCIYILAIPGFAILYVFVCGNAFYSNVVAKEQRFIQQQKSFVALVNRDLTKQEHLSKLIPCSRSSPHIKTSGAYVKSIDFDNVTFILSIHCWKSFNLRYNDDTIPTHIARDHEAVIHFDVRGAGPTHASDQSFVSFENIKPQDSNDDSIIQTLLPENGFYINGDVAQSGWKMLNIARGNLTFVDGYFSEMLYFSVVIISTLGLGDIVPITDLARLLVGMEAFVGVLMFGLFFNSLAYRASLKR